ncbi:unnamed protein product [Schistosoma margrebowiei]|uniref:Dynamin stalk domain-containing protein n=1 Tax=Schistosoma margrebowiei TaxID=48269 RepID=A0A183M0E2_9TREM|nr:unnamed protein product [Schistosoma margrebowiei]
MVQSFEAEFSQNISGHAADVNTQILSGGAEINRVFHERFRYDLLKIEFDEKTLRKEIAVAIQNIHGVRPGLFTPDMAFDATVRKQIEKLRIPSLKCVDMVVSKLTDVLQQCSDKDSSQSSKFELFPFPFPTTIGFGGMLSVIHNHFNITWLTVLCASRLFAILENNTSWFCLLLNSFLN